MRRGFLVGMTMVAGLAGGAQAATGPTLQDRQQAACYDDVMRLCGDYVPDAERVKACMNGKKKLVSPACAAFYPPGAK